MKNLFILIGFIALTLLCTQEAQAYSYWEGNHQTQYTSYDRPYQAAARQGYSYNTGLQPRSTFIVSDGRSNYGSRYIGGYFPAYYQAPRPYGYQANQFNRGADYGKAFKPTTSSWYYGRGNSDYYYDGNYRRQSSYYQYN